MPRYTSLLRLASIGAVALTMACLPPEGSPSRDPNTLPPGTATAEQVARMTVEPNISAVAAFYDANRWWLKSPDQSGITGIKVGALYLFGPKGMGVFGEGVIRPKLYILERKPDGSRTPVLAKEWSFDINQAIPLRAKKPTAMGWGYALFLDWGDLELAGKEIRMIISFERPDGHVVQSGKRDFRVPLTVS